MPLQKCSYISTNMLATACRRLSKNYVRNIKQSTRCAGSAHQHRLPANIDTANNIIHSPLSSVDIPDLNLGEYIWQNVEKWKDKTALTDSISGRSYTYKQVHAMTERLELSLPDTLGLKPGDILGIVMPNCPEYTFVVLATTSAGLAVSTANPVYTAEEIARQMTNAGAKAVVTVPELLPKVKEAMERVPGGGQVIVATDGSAAQEASLKAAHPELLSLHELMAREYTRNAPRLPRADPDSLAVLPYSSGTTGLPKGVRLTHRNLVANLCQTEHPDMLQVKNRHGNQNITLAVLPYYHIYGLVVVMAFNLRVGRHTVTLPRFEPNLFTSAFSRYKPTVMNVVPPLLLFLANTDKISKQDFANLQWIMTGAAPATTTVIEKFMTRVDPQMLEFREGYGMTELSPTAVLTPSRKYGLNVLGSTGVPIPNTDVKIVDENGKAVSQGKHGEIYIRGPQVMQGYHNNEQATRETITEDGWLKTGDVAYVNSDGLVFIVDRMKELIKVKALQVSPTELEAVVRKMEGVADVAVLGVPDERAGERPLAFVVKAPNSTVTENQVVSYVEARVAPHKKVSQVRFVDAIPKSAAGKILRRTLKEMIAST